VGETAQAESTHCSAHRCSTGGRKVSHIWEPQPDNANTKCTPWPQSSYCRNVYINVFPRL